MKRKSFNFLNTKPFKEGDTVFIKHGESIARGKVHAVSKMCEAVYIGDIPSWIKSDSFVGGELRVNMHYAWHSKREVVAYAKAAWDDILAD